MLIKSGLVTQISGSFGGMTGSHNRGGMYLRARSIPVDPGSTLQQVIRDGMANLAARWRDQLTEAQRDDWRTYAANTPLLSPLGDARDVGGLPMYTRGNIIRYQIGATIIDDAPTSGLPVLTTPTNLALLTGDGLLTGDLAADDWTTNGGNFLAVYASRPLSAAIGFFKGPYRLIGTVEGNNLTPPTDFSLDYGAIFGTPADGAQVRTQFRVVDTQARLSAAVREAVIVTT